MKLHQRAAAVLMACALALTLAACGPTVNNNVSTNQTTTNTTAGYTITVKSSSTSNGTVNATTSGSKVTVTATPKSGYVFKGWQKDGVLVSTSLTYTFTPTSTCTVVAVFEKAVTNYTVTAKANSTTYGTVTGGGTYASGTKATVTATAKSGYVFKGWQQNGSTVSTSASYSFTVTGNTALTAVFEAEPVTNYTVTAKANSDAYGTVTGAGSYAMGTSVTVTASPNAGYTFKGWQQDGSIISTDTAYTFNVTGDRTLIAVFEAQVVKKVIWATTTDSNGVTTLTGYNEAGAIPSGDLVIPSQIGGKTISKIGDNFLKEDKLITSVTIPGTVESIGTSAFYGCVNLKTVIVQEGVTTICNWAFQNCTSLVTVSLPETLTRLGGEKFYSGSYDWAGGSYGNHIFAGCTSLKQIRLPSNLTYIACENFEGCTSLERVCIPAGVTVIYSSAFKDCTSLSAVYYGGDATSWGNVQVESGNDYLSSVETVYFNQTGF